ncbi:MAG: hypothetical protein MSIBF_06950 [Candidatus Altiarchaeales archaeon IMC4]|nr:MAG: hypothetical protein MSIBF_06950 [Candidatus Altiarchaeales archaeon IMC4]
MPTSEVIADKIAQSVGIVAGNALEYAMLLVYAVIVLAIGWVVGALVEKIVVRVLKRPEIETGLVNYGAATGKLWSNVVGFLGRFVFVWVVIAIFAATFGGPNPDSVVNCVFYAVSNLFVFSILVLCGVLTSGIMYKIAKDILAGAGFDASLRKHGMSETIGNIHISSAIAGVIKLYVVLMFLQEAANSVGTNEIKNMIAGLMAYISSAILGAAVLLVAVVLADFVAVLIKKKNYPFADTITVVAEGIILFFGIVLALPKFGIQDVTILTYSFLIVIAGLSLGLAMAIGLGLKDSVNSIAVETRRGRKKKEEV